MSISLFKVSLNELCGIISKKASIEHILREGYTSFNNACVLYFKNVRLNKRSFVAYGYCKHPSCNHILFRGSYDGLVNVYTSSPQISHTIGYKKSTQCRSINRFIEKAAIRNRTAFEYRSQKKSNLNMSRARVGKTQITNRNYPFTEI